MSIQGVGSSNFFSGVVAVGSTGGQAGAAPAHGEGVSSAAPSLSRQGQFLARLQSLEQTDPAQAKQLLTALADKLRGEASHAGGASSRRAQLADTLQKAADTGDLSGLLDAAAAKSGGSWSRGAAAYSQTMAVTRASR